MRKKATRKTAKRTKAKASKPVSISMTALLNKASRNRSLFRRLMKDPEATLARENLKVSADNLKKLDRMSKLIKKRIPLKLKPGATAKVLALVDLPKNSEWIPDWRSGWLNKRFPSIAGQIKLPKSLN